MEKLKKLVENNPKFKSDRSEYLKLAEKNEKGAVISTGPHKVKLLGCENAVNRDYKTQKEVKGVNLLFEEEGQKKKYFVPILGEDGKFHYLIEKFAEIEEGTELILEYKRREGSAKGFIDVRSVEGEEVDLPSEEDEIPIVEDEDYGATEEDFGPGYDIEVQGEEQV